MAIFTSSVEVLACYDASCRPPTSGGSGGSKKGSGSGPTPEQRKAYNSGYAAAQRGSWDALGKADQRRVPKAWYAGYYDADAGKPKGSAFTDPEYAPLFGKPKAAHPVITASEARGDSRPVSAAEFQRLAARGQAQLDKMAANSSPTTGLDQNWSKIKAETYDEVRKPWGGATIDAHTGKTLPQGVNKYAITVKDRGVETVSVKEDATPAEFDAAMNTAKQRFGSILEREGHHLGVFHDDDNGRIDIDPVLVVDKSSDVETIGAASRAIGGAYNFADGLGYWPPHVDSSPSRTRKRDDYQRTYEE